MKLIIALMIVMQCTVTLTAVVAMRVMDDTQCSKEKWSIIERAGK